MTGNEADALDATQEVLLTIARRLDRFDGRATFSTWAYRVATNACLDELRRRRRRPEPIDPHVIVERRPGRTDDASMTVPTRLALDEALDTLPETFRVAVVLRDVLTFDYAEIAQILDIPIGTVRSRIARGRALLAAAFIDDGNLEPSAERPTPRDNTAVRSNNSAPRAASHRPHSEP